MLKLVRAAVILTLVTLPMLVSADDTPDGGQHHRWPRPEALAACKDKSEGDACTFDGRHGTVSGTCRQARTGDLVCVHPHHSHEGTGGGTAD